MKELLNRVQPFINLREKLITRVDNQASIDVGFGRSYRKDSNRKKEESDHETNVWYDKYVPMSTS